MEEKCRNIAHIVAAEWTVIPMFEILELLRDILRGEDNNDDTGP